MNELVVRVARAVEQERVFRRVSRLVVGVSGGADSVACLLILLELREKFGFEVAAAHFDHQLRADSAADLAYVRDLCGRLGISCTTGEGDVGAAARAQRISAEEMGRRARYEFLAFAAGKERAEAVATGHTATDQAETILQHILRGSGVRGLRGMLPVAPVPGATALRLLRPLLPLTHDETRAFCAEAGVVPLEDPSNSDIAIQRNRIRIETMPSLRGINPSVDDALIRLGESARELFEPLERQSNTVQPFSRGPEGAVFVTEQLRQLPTEALTLVLERETSFTRTAFQVNRTRLENLRHVLVSGSGQVVFGETVVEVGSGRARVGAAMPSTPFFERKVVNLPGVTAAGPWRVEASTEALSEEPGTQVVVLDNDRIDGVLRAGPLDPNARIPYRGQSRRLRFVLQAEGVPQWEREFTLGLYDRSGVVALVGAAARVLPLESPAGDSLNIRIRRADPPPA